VRTQPDLAIIEQERRLFAQPQMPAKGDARPTASGVHLVNLLRSMGV
jgi:hypothetical protein